MTAARSCSYAIRAPAGAVVHALGWHLLDWSDFELHLAIDFEPFVVELGRGAKKRKVTIRPVFSWKRSRKVITIAKRHSIGRTPEAERWARAAAACLKAQWAPVASVPIPGSIELNAAIVSYLPSARLTDASNLYQGPEDVLQACRAGKRSCKASCKIHAGVITDDSVIRSHDGSDRRIDRAHPRVEITLTPHAPGRARLRPEQWRLL